MGSQEGLADIESRQPIRRDTIFRLFSLSKPIVAASILPLIDSGLLLHWHGQAKRPQVIQQDLIRLMKSHDALGGA
eukprot:1755476-Amphidinium_carterae.1